LIFHFKSISNLKKLLWRKFFKSFTTIFYFKFFELRKVLFRSVKILEDLN
jgi:hypothetical protein